MVDIKRIQNRLLEMAKVIHNILEKNNIPYMIAYGTLLGAVRHQGFIPWDDDFDIYLFEDENNSYEDAVKILQKELPEDMFLEYFDTEPKYFHAWAHVKDLNSEVSCDAYPQDNSYSHHGLSIDLYRTCKIKEKDLKKFREKENREYLDRRKELNLISEDEYNKRLEKGVNINSKEFDINSGTDIYEAFDILRKMSINEIFPLKKYQIEDFEFWGPNNYDAILKRRYGDYMKLPPEEQRKSHYSSVLFFDK